MAKQYSQNPYFVITIDKDTGLVAGIRGVYKANDPDELDASYVDTALEVSTPPDSMTWGNAVAAAKVKIGNASGIPLP